MLARIRKSLDEKDQGFTLIELLVVMIIIGILSAIAIPVFLSQRAKAQDAATKADISTIGKEIATYFVDNSAAPASGVVIASNRYTVNGTDVGKVSQTTITVQQGAATNWTAGTWCVALVNSAGSGSNAGERTWKYSAQNGLERGACTSTIAP
jgi:prepilin-type N-terminal cleavage/methylation domain-containing protein